ncbi:DUF218 domain-containing protein [Dunaliella salina]|uniref:DUF218 domain-containing protein n=1 Tax=Dunaliella salina TaxID=3046 RepID=A0ABQ7G193_DUNSA|nr:DUF218 domain-containing protein [Dunaliella salina]|eukprot:KAF5828380.1 DUF218 domain-containing protein [Dunaliella salina]
MLCRLAGTMSTKTLVSRQLLLPRRTRRLHLQTQAQTSPLSVIDAEGVTPSKMNAEMKLDAIIVLGGGLSADGDLPLWVKRRLDLAHSLYSCQIQRPPILCSGGGTPHKPPVLDQEGFVVHEATRCSDYLQTEKLVPAADILKEVSSYDTVGNAYFCLSIHAIPAQWKRLAVVTSSFHMPRSRALFEHMWCIAHASQGVLLHARSELYFAEASDEGVFDRNVLEVRATKEREALNRWQQDSAHLPDLKHLHWWLHQTHRCYAVARQHEGLSKTVQPRDERLLASY